jgi:glutamyl-tRNA synthetase
VVDDHLMQITHVIRGEEWISSTPKHVLLYQYFQWDIPVFAHLPLLRNPDKSKLSKRKNPTGINYYRDTGYLPEAMCNYLGMMGYTLPDQREIFSVQELVESFDIKRMSLGGPVFDLAKLKWLNGRYLREQMTEEEVVNRMIEWKLNSNFIQKLISHALPRLENFSDFIPLSGFLFEEHPNLEFSSLVGKTEPIEASKLIKICEWELEKTSPWERENICEVFQKMAVKEDLKLKNMLPGNQRTKCFTPTL